MFGMGWQEILLVVAIAVLVIGPDQLPQVARGLGKMMAQFRRATSDLRDAVNEEVHQYQEMDEIKEFTSDLQSEVRSFGTTAQDYLEREIEKGEKELTGEEDKEDAAPTAETLPTEDYGPVVPSAEEITSTKPVPAQDGASQGGEPVAEATDGNAPDKQDTPKDDSHKETA